MLDDDDLQSPRPTRYELASFVDADYGHVVNVIVDGQSPREGQQRSPLQKYTVKQVSRRMIELLKSRKPGMKFTNEDDRIIPFSPEEDCCRYVYLDRSWIIWSFLWKIDIIFG